MTSPDTHERAWTLPAAAGLAAVEATVAIAVLLYSHDRPAVFVVFLAAKYPICFFLLRRQPWTFFALLLWEFTVAVAAIGAPRIPLALRAVELAMAGGVIGLLFASAHLFPSAQLPRPPRRR